MSERHDWTHAQAQSEIARLREALAKAEAVNRELGGNSWRTIECENCYKEKSRAVSAEALLAEAKEVLDQLVTFCGSEDTALVETRHIRAGRAFLAKLKQREGSNG